MPVRLAGHNVGVEIELTYRDLQPVDIDLLAWSGGDAHLTALQKAMERSWAGTVELVVAELPNGRLVACGGVDFDKEPGTGWLWMLSVDDAWQSLGIGAALVAELERRCLDRGVERAALSVEHDNPRATALYRRLGYRGDRTVVETWPTDRGVTGVTSCLVMEHELAAAKWPEQSQAATG